MDAKRKKELIMEYKNRKPEMGIISFLCIESGEVFLGISKDTRADFQSVTGKLSFNGHPNKKFQELWNKYGKDGFEFSVPKILKYEDPHKDHTDELKELLEKSFEENPKAKKIWR